ncbi:MAG: response regulator [Elusimicrobia bacterium]|nr:response regulator [Elusimicrobiota bacterium]
MTINHIFNLFLLFFIGIITVLLTGIFLQNRGLKKISPKDEEPDLGLAEFSVETEIAVSVLSEGVDAVVACDLTEAMTFVNYRGEKFLEYTAVELRGKNLLTVVAEPARADLKKEISFRQANEYRVIQTTLLSKNNRRLEVMVKMLPLYHNGKIAGSIYLFTDISFLKQAEKETQLQQKELQSLIKLCAMLGASLDLKEVLDFIVKAITEFARADACTLRLLSDDGQDLVLSASYGVEVSHHPEKVRLDGSITGQVVQGKRVVIIPDLSQESTYQSSPIVAEEKMASLLCIPLVVKNTAKGAFCLYTKQTCQFTQRQIDLVKAFADQAAIALENARLYSQEQQMVVKLRELNQAKSDFLSMVSHELRSPLTSIKGYTALMLAGHAGETNESQKRFLKIVEEQSDHLTNLITELLNLSRIEAGQVRMNKSSLSLKALTETIVDRLRSHFEQKKINLTAIIQDDLPFVYADKDKLIQVLANFLTNALKFTPENGRVIIEIFEKDKNVEARISDTGIGILPGELEKIFEKFYQVDSSSTRQTGGAGLGLAIVKRIVEMHAGKVWAESDGPNKGSHFCFLLPAFRPMTSDRELVRASRSKRDLPGQKTILLVDAEQDILNLHKIYLEDEGYHVIWALTGQQAIARSRSDRPDLILLDIKLPDLDGIQVLKTLKDDPQTKNIAVLIVSVLPDRENQTRLLGINDYLTKPVDKKQLLAKVSETLGERGAKKRGTVLIADDEPNVVESIKISLQEEGYNTKVAIDGEEALAKTKELKPDLLLLDVMMPKIDGYEVLKTLKSDPDLFIQKIPVIIISARKMAEDKRQGLDLGAAKYITKPFKVKELLSEIARIIG